jgi:hypothetical protein
MTDRERFICLLVVSAAVHFPLGCATAFYVFWDFNGYFWESEYDPEGSYIDFLGLIEASSWRPAVSVLVAFGVVYAVTSFCFWLAMWQPRESGGRRHRWRRFLARLQASEIEAPGS